MGNHILPKMKGFLVIGVLCGVALASDYQYVEVVPSHSTPSHDGLNVYIASYEDEYSTALRQVHRPHHSAGYRPHYKPQRTAYRYVVEPQPQYYPQRHSRGYSTNVPVYGELKPVSAPIIHRLKPFHLPKLKIVETSHKPALYDHSNTGYEPAYSYGGHQRTGYSTLPQYYPVYSSQLQYYPHPTSANYPTPVYPLSPPVHTSSQRVKHLQPELVSDALQPESVEDAEQTESVADGLNLDPSGLQYGCDYYPDYDCTYTY